MKTCSVILSLCLFIGAALTTRAAEADPKVTALLKQADAKVEAKDIKGALELADQAVKTNGQDLRGYYFRGRLYELDKQYEKALPDYTEVLKLDPKASPLYQRRGEVNFRLGNFKESVADFDELIKRFPEEEPRHWQRGISHYYAGMYAEGVKQFADHRTVNGNDVENSVFHYICLVKAKDKATALKEFIPTGGDSRVPMMEIHALYSGKGSIEEVLKACRAGDPKPEELKNRLFYAHLYIGLWYESEGKAKEAREHIFKAAGEYGVEGYMGDVARAHAAVFRKQDGAKKP
ncbi:MAG: nlpI [Verrucomicrobia bacterium]|jgi:lipoprotein NlpI|nr:nlpI [Verrucomicrobiota bacterium]